MTKEEAIKYLQQIYPNGGHCWLDEQRIEAIEMAIDVLKDQPISEDFKLFEKEYLEKEKDEILCVYDRHAGLVDGVQWQKEQFEKNRLKHCNNITNEQAELEQGFIDQHLNKYQRMPTFLDAIEYGMRLQQEQMMANATDVTVHIDAGNYPYIQQIELYDYDKDIPLAKEGDKYKVVLIKEE